MKKLPNYTKFLEKKIWPLLWMGFSCLKAGEPQLGDSLLFTTKSPQGPGTHLIDLGSMKERLER